MSRPRKGRPPRPIKNPIVTKTLAAVAVYGIFSIAAAPIPVRSPAHGSSPFQWYVAESLGQSTSVPVEPRLLSTSSVVEPTRGRPTLRVAWVFCWWAITAATIALVLVASSWTGILTLLTR